MTVSKGDLVLVSNVDSKTVTCVILTEKYIFGTDRGFYYTFCIETGQYGLVYENEISCVVAKDFHHDFEFDTDSFDEEYYWYEILMNEYGSFWPRYWVPNDQDSEDDE